VIFAEGPGLVKRPGPKRSSLPGDKSTPKHLIKAGSFWRCLSIFGIGISAIDQSLAQIFDMRTISGMTTNGESACRGKIYQKIKL
jgi:hypothetical protein